MRVDEAKYKDFYVDASKLEMMLKLLYFCLGSKEECCIKNTLEGCKLNNPSPYCLEMHP